jgi:hypothetical protein
LRLKEQRQHASIVSIERDEAAGVERHSAHAARR